MGTGTSGHSESDGGVVVAVRVTAVAAAVLSGWRASCRSSRFGLGLVSAGGFRDGGVGKDENPGRSSGFSERRPLIRERAGACDKKGAGTRR